jgi:sporulation protein YabP
MNNEINNLEHNHVLTINNRKKLEISGVKRIESINEEEFVLDTYCGMLHLSGTSLEMQHLDVDKGIIWINGTIDSFAYAKEKKQEESFFKKLFK